MRCRIRFEESRCNPLGFLVFIQIEESAALTLLTRKLSKVHDIEVRVVYPKSRSVVKLCKIHITGSI